MLKAVRERERESDEILLPPPPLPLQLIVSFFFNVDLLVLLCYMFLVDGLAVVNVCCVR